MVLLSATFKLFIWLICSENLVEAGKIGKTTILLQGRLLKFPSVVDDRWNNVLVGNLGEYGPPSYELKIFSINVMLLKHNGI